jgi:hypothetical protein
MRRSRWLTGLLVLPAILALPTLVAAHEITHVDVDCDGEAIVVHGKLFAQDDGGRTVTVTGPGGYLQTFFADQDEPWSMTLPLGPDGDYLIDWPDSGDFGPVSFVVECEDGEVQPTGPEEPNGEVKPSTGSPSGGAAPTLPPTDGALVAAGRTDGFGLHPAAILALVVILGTGLVLRRPKPTAEARDRQR